MKFNEFNFSEVIYKTLEKSGYSEATPIQSQAIPHILEGKDIAGLAQTGTGKTAAFLLPLMDRILWAQKNTEQLSEADKAVQQVRAFPDWKSFHYVLVLVPTRELAEQVVQNVEMLGEGTGLRGASIYGGTSYDKQKEAVKRGVEFLVATPGRLIDLFKENIIDLKLVRAVVFDEADRMFDMGFKDDMKFILQRIPKERQFLVFSATLNFDVLNTAYQFGANPIEINISRDQTKAENVKDTILHLGQEEKPQFLLSLIKKYNPKQTIIFSNYKTNIDRIVNFLNINGIPAMGLSSLITQGQRNKVLAQFKAENEHNILVATDVAARGLDIKGVDLVINYDLPSDSESYVHRIGRTGRAGAEGVAISFVSDRDVDALMRVEEYLKHKLETTWLEEIDILKEFKPMPFERKEFGSKNNQGSFRPKERGPRGPNDRKGGFQNDGRKPFRKEGQTSEKRPDQRKPRPDGQRSDRKHEGFVNKKFDPKKQHEHQKNFKESGKPAAGPTIKYPAKKPLNKPAQAPKQKSLGQKVAGFFKTLFK